MLKLGNLNHSEGGRNSMNVSQIKSLEKIK